MPGRHPASSALLIAALALAAFAPTGLAATPVALTGTVPGALPTQARGETDLLVYAIANGRVVAARTLNPKTGRFSLRLPAGAYALRTAIVDRRATRPSRGVIPVSLRAGQRRRPQKLTVRRAPARKRSTTATAAYVQESGKTTQGTAVAIEDFTGATGEWGVLNRGLSQMLMTDLVDQAARCKGAVVANSREREVLQEELDLQDSPAFDPSTKVTRDWIAPDVVVTGTLQNAGDGVDVTLTLTDARSGQAVGTVTGRISGSDWVNDEAKLAKELTRKVCRQPEAYQVSITAQATANFVAYTTQGTAEGLVLARAQDGDEDTAPTRWQSEPSEIAWSGVSFTSTGLTPCVWTQATTEGSWQVSLASTGDGNVTVTTQGLPGAKVTANAICPPSQGVATGQGGPSLVMLAPETFTVPAGGGTKTLSGSLIAWSSTATITVRPSAPPGR
jgi:TolB-like protein